MKTAMIFAAGVGERMRPLTLTRPKPLLEVHGVSLIARQLQKLKAAGVERVVVNLSYLANMIVDALGSGSQFGLDIVYSDEGAIALETGGGIQHALHLLGSAPFILTNGDLWTDFDYASLPDLQRGQQAHLVLVNNPPHHLEGDFALENGRCSACGSSKFTYSGIGVFSPALFADLPAGRYRLAPILREAMSFGDVRGELYCGEWTDVGTPERLAQLNAVRLDARV